jgi:hypothetical protein
MTAFERAFQELSNDLQGLGLKTAQMVFFSLWDPLLIRRPD